MRPKSDAANAGMKPKSDAANAGNGAPGAQGAVAPQGLAPQGPGPRQARARALELLYQRHFLNITPEELLASLPLEPDALALNALTGVCEHLETIDAHINKSSTGWKTDRMPAVDREILRLGVWELLERQDISVSVIINEAVELAKEYSTEASPAFVNGVLDTISNLVRETVEDN